MENNTGLPDGIIEELKSYSPDRVFAASELESESGRDIRVVYFVYNNVYYYLVEKIGHKKSYHDYHTWEYDGLTEITEMDMITARIQYTDGLIVNLINAGWQETAKSFLEDILDELKVYTLKYAAIDA